MLDVHVDGTEVCFSAKEVAIAPWDLVTGERQWAAIEQEFVETACVFLKKAMPNGDWGLYAVYSYYDLHPIDFVQNWLINYFIKS
jgi:hypothetical protein